MSRFIFISLLVVASLVRGPISVILIVLKNFNQTLRKRFEFERKNFLEDECRSFKKDGLIADYCFEVSSEGELEQVRPLIEYFLKANKKIEILFASPSVESKCLKLARENINNLRVLRLPIVTHLMIAQTPRKWMTSSKLIFCRYDFFPELLILRFLGVRFILLSAAAKNPSWFKSEVYKCFDVIVAANKTEENYFKEHLKTAKVFDFDFRIPRIFERVTNAKKTLDDVKELKSYLSFIDSITPSSKLILGSAWISDFVIFNDPKWKEAIQSGQIHLLVVPHDLGPASIDEMKKALKEKFDDVSLYEISKSKMEFDYLRPGIVILNMSGVLCELYTKFKLAYVGGGFARSIHSVLEPYLSGTTVFCGPKIHRSTEFDYICELSPDEIHLLNNPESFYNLFIENASRMPDQSVRDALKLNALSKMESIIKEIESC